ncbi:response regulator [Pelagimonas sp. KU-00592-HH]|uniref:response regulator n=1 Tax=Roseobacteraceae TaxID=2854170 RepID=UPI0020CF8E19|nr:response regulator [Shimia sp. CNT1-13L.2]MCP9483217.1 response regulator [Shimia sp. CNT1-13L.2]
MTAKQILAVDDSRTMRNMLKQTLGEAGYEVSLAEDGVDGVERLRDLTPDLVITDINMPRMDGFRFIEEVRGLGRLRGVPILVLTTESDQALRNRARAAGATGWIVKPFDDGNLISAIRKVTVG